MSVKVEFGDELEHFVRVRIGDDVEARFVLAVIVVAMKLAGYETIDNTTLATLCQRLLVRDELLVDLCHVTSLKRF